MYRFRMIDDMGPRWCAERQPDGSYYYRGTTYSYASLAVARLAHRIMRKRGYRDI